MSGTMWSPSTSPTSLSTSVKFVEKQLRPSKHCINTSLRIIKLHKSGINIRGSNWLLLRTLWLIKLLYKFHVLEVLAVLEARISGMMWKDEDKTWNCSICGKISKSKTDITRHIEGLHLDHPGFKCDVCGEVVKSRNAMRQHKTNRHGPPALLGSLC